MTAASSGASTDLKDYLQILRHRKWSILAITAFVIISALAFSLQETPVYESHAQVVVTPLSLSSNQPGVAAVAPNMDTEKNLAASASVASIVNDRFGLKQDPTALLQHLSVTVPTNTELLDISYSSTKANQARQLAQGFAEGYLQYRRDTAVQQVQSALDPLQKNIVRLDQRIQKFEDQLAATSDPATQAALQTRIQALVGRKSVIQQQVASITPPANLQVGQVVAPAETPGSPASPSYIKNLLLAVIVGLALGVGIALLRERLDEHFTDRAELQAHTGSPVLAVVPKVRGNKGRTSPVLMSSTMPQSVAADAYRTLRAGVLYAASRTDAKVLLVTSAFEGEGKTTTAANLAVALAQVGKRVVLVSADLRKPRLHEFFGGSSPVGLATVLSGQTTIDRAIVPSSIDELQILFSGGVRENAAELVGSEAMRRVLAELRERNDFVIVDAAPILLVADTATLLPNIDGVLLVLDPAISTRAAADDVREQLDQLNARRMGTVINNLEKSKARAYRHHAGYYSYYQDRPAREVRASEKTSTSPLQRPRKGETTTGDVPPSTADVPTPN